MSKKKQTEKEELFSILSDTMNGANFDDLNDACYRIIEIANYHKRNEGEWVRPTKVGGMTLNMPHCSVCGKVPCDEGEYCPKCGAYMKGGK